MTTNYRPELIQSAFVDFIGSRLRPFWSLNTPKLRLIDRHTLSEELIALRFECNRAFKPRIANADSGWQGGQYINLTVPIDGIYHQRSYSLVGLPKQALWWHQNTTDKASIHNRVNNKISHKFSQKKRQRQTLTIALKPQGVVSDYLTKQAAVGTVFDSSMPCGDFTLQHASVKNLSVNSQTPLLLIAGGSGITPMLGLISQALQDKRSVTLVHYNRQPVLESHWQQIASEHPNFNYHLIDTQNPNSYLAARRHLQAASLLALDLPLLETQIFACGSQNLLASLYAAVDELDDRLLDKNQSDNGRLIRDNIIVERFGLALPEQVVDALGESLNLTPHTVYLRSRQRQFSSGHTLLVSAEQAGIRLNYGCRQGICQLCRCNKVSGVVKNIQTGKLSGDGYDSIQTCIHVAMSDVVLDI